MWWSLRRKCYFGQKIRANIVTCWWWHAGEKICPGREASSEHWLLCSFSLAVVVPLCGAAPQKPWISACYSQHHSCWRYVGVAVDCKNTFPIKEQNQCCLLLSCQLRLCHLYPCFIFINFIPPLNLLIYLPFLPCKKSVRQNNWQLHVAMLRNETIVCLCSAEGKCWIFL